MPGGIFMPGIESFLAAGFFAGAAGFEFVDFVGVLDALEDVAGCG